jgi:hypothetical protein
MKDGTLGSGRYDGMDEFLTRSTNSTNSSSNGSPNLADRIEGGVFHYSHQQPLRQNVNPYFQDVQYGAASPLENVSPLYDPTSTQGQTVSRSDSVTPTGRSPSASAGYVPLNGPSPSGYPSDASPFTNAHPQDRFPFSVDAHTSPAIRG